MKKKKSIKGMTLIEIIISIAVLAIMGTIMCKIATTSNSMLKASNHLNKRTAAQAPLSAAGDISSGKVEETDFTISISGPFDASSVHKITAVKYSAQAETLDPTEPTDAMNANLHYYSYVIETESETTPETTT